LAKTARPRKAPRKRELKEVEEVKEAEDSEVGIRPSNLAAKTMAMVNIAAKGMSVAAAWEKPIMPTVVGRRRSSQRAVSAP
jgi:hypothetical protein